MALRRGCDHPTVMGTGDAAVKSLGGLTLFPLFWNGHMANSQGSQWIRYDKIVPVYDSNMVILVTDTLVSRYACRVSRLHNTTNWSDQFRGFQLHFDFLLHTAVE